MPQTQTSIADEVDRMIEARSLLKHPFYKAWQRDGVIRTARRCLDALWSFRDGVYETSVAPETAG